MIEAITGDKSTWGSRKDRIGASDIPIILGLSKFKSAAQLWEQKKKDLIEPASLPMLVGTACEKDLFAWFLQNVAALRKNRGLSEIDPTTITHNETSYKNLAIGAWATATPDGFEGDTGLVQIKYSKSQKKWGDGSELPEDVYAQVQWEMLILNRERNHVYCILETFAWQYQEIYFEVKRNDTFLNEVIIPQAVRFWNSLSGDENIWLSESARPKIPVVKGTIGVADSETEKLARWYKEMRDEKSIHDKKSAELKAKMENVKEKIIPSFGDKQYLELSDSTKIERRFTENKGYTVQPFSYTAIYIK